MKSLDVAVKKLKLVIKNEPSFEELEKLYKLLNDRNISFSHGTEPQMTDWGGYNGEIRHIYIYDIGLEALVDITKTIWDSISDQADYEPYEPVGE